MGSLLLSLPLGTFLLKLYVTYGTYSVVCAYDVVATVTCSSPLSTVDGVYFVFAAMLLHLGESVQLKAQDPTGIDRASYAKLCIVLNIR